MTLTTYRQGTTRMHRCHLPALLAFGTLLLSGCISNPTLPGKSAEQSELYAGQPIVSFLADNQAKTPEEALQRGQSALAQNQVDRALFEFIRAFELAPDNTQALLKIGDIHARRGNLQLANVSYRKALSIDDSLIAAHEGLGLTLFKLKHIEEAKNPLSRAIDLDKARIKERHPLLKGDAQSPIRAYNAMGVILDLAGQHGDARLYFRQALDIRPGYIEASNNLGYSYYLSGQWGKAETHFRNALKGDPGYPLAWRNLGLLYARMGKYMNAMEAMRRVMPAAQAYNDIGYICLMNEQYIQAEQFFLKAINLNPSYYQTAQNNLQQVRRRMNMEISAN